MKLIGAMLHKVHLDGHHASSKVAHTQEAPPKMDFLSPQVFHTQESYLNDLTERPPGMQNYRRLASIVDQMQQAHPMQIKTEPGANRNDRMPMSVDIEKTKADEKPKATKFGWFQGVFMRCFLNILGVMLYLRISWVTGQAGIGLSAVIVLLATVVTTLTALSVCAIVTNGEVKGGGAYYLISRSLGPEFGGAIGLVFFVANAVGAAMYIVGVAETVVFLFKENDVAIIDGDIWDMRIIGEGVLLLLVIICFVGVGFESKMQFILMGMLVLSILDYYIGLCIPYDDEKKAKGAVDFNFNLFRDNFLPQFDPGENLFTVFAVYFPAATGIMAGANISGDLKNAAYSIPLGTLLAILLTTIIYLSVAVFTGLTSVRYASGIVEDYHNLVKEAETNGTSWYFLDPACHHTEAGCKYGLMNSGQVVTLTSAWAPLILAGIFAATLSSALASLVSAPKIFQAVCNDNLFPLIAWFGKGFGKDNEPRRALFLTTLIAFAMIMIADLNAIAPLISNFFLATYGLINYSVFDASFAGSPGFRPSFKYYNRWASLLGAILCVIVMFIMGWVTALVTFVILAVIYVYVLRRKPDANWGSSGQAHSYRSALTSMWKLQYTPDHVKNYRPQILVLSGNPLARPALVDFASAITKDTSLLQCGQVLKIDGNEGSHQLNETMQKLRDSVPVNMKARKVRGFYACVATKTLYEGALALMYQCGMGGLRPNIVMIGYIKNASRAAYSTVTGYVNIIRSAAEQKFGVCILKLGNDVDISETVKALELSDLDLLRLSKELRKTKQKNISAFKEGNLKALEKIEVVVTPTDGDEIRPDIESPISNISMDEQFETSFEPKRSIMYDIVKNDASEHQRQLLVSLNQCQDRVKNGVIDIWWLHDDGGLTLLLPYLLTLNKSFLAGSQLRVFTVANYDGDFGQEQKDIQALLAKLRIRCSVSVVNAVDMEISLKTRLAFDKFVDDLAPTDVNVKDEMEAFKKRTIKHLRTSQLIRAHSIDKASLIVLTMPMTKPREGLVPVWLFTSWLEILVDDLRCPVLLIRGNNTPVLTMHSS